MVKPVRILLDNRQLWLPCTQPYLIPGLPLPCVDGMWLVVVVRLWPSVLVSFVNLAVAYQVSVPCQSLQEADFTEGLQRRAVA